LGITVAGAAGRLAFKLLSTVVAIPVGRLIASATGKAWATARPDDPPHDPKEVQTSWSDAILFSVITGLGVAIAQLLTTKGADTAWRALTGRPSPRPKEPKGAKARQEATL
jgi:hypothetical protein